MQFLAIKAYFDALRQWPLTTVSLTATFMAFSHIMSGFESTGAPAGDVWRAVLAFIVCAAVAVITVTVAPPFMGWLVKKVLGLSDADFDGVKAQTGHMSFQWTYENSAKGKREIKRQLEEDGFFGPEDGLD